MVEVVIHMLIFLLPKGRINSYRFEKIDRGQHKPFFQMQFISVNQKLYLYTLFGKPMATSDCKISKSSLLLYRPFDMYSKSPIAKREDNFVLDCTNKQNAALPPYKTQEDSFLQPYLQTLIQKMGKQSIESAPALKIRNLVHIPKKKNNKVIGADQFKSFLQSRKEKVIRQMNQTSNGWISNRSSCQKEEQQELKKKKSSQKQKFIQLKYNCYKIRNIKTGLSKNKRKKGIQFD